MVEVARLRLERAEEVVLEMVLVVLVRLALGRGFATLAPRPVINSAIAPAIADSAVSAVPVVTAGAEITAAFFAKPGKRLDSRGGSIGRCAPIASF